METDKNIGAPQPESVMLDQLVMALAEEIALETGSQKLDILERIVETGESFQINPSSTPPLSPRNVLA